IVVFASSPRKVMAFLPLGMSRCSLYVPGLIWTTTRSVLFHGTAPIAACTVLKSPVPSPATVRSLANAADVTRRAQREHEVTKARRGTKRNDLPSSFVLLSAFLPSCSP